MTKSANILMCEPTHYGIEYEINPWMNCERQSDHAVACEQWQALHDTLERLHVTISKLPPVKGLTQGGLIEDQIRRY